MPKMRARFKWLHEEDDVPARSEVFCPYCGGLSPVDQCWTKSQVEAMQAAAGQEMLSSLQGSGFEVTINPPPLP